MLFRSVSNYVFSRLFPDRQIRSPYRRAPTIGPAPSSRHFVLLTLLSKSIAQTLQRFYMAISLLLNSGQNTLSSEELDDLCTMMAQRLSILHGLNAPEFFDKSLFRHFIETLLEQDVLRRDANGKLTYLAPLLSTWAEGDFSRDIQLGKTNRELRDIESSLNRLRSYLVNLVGTLRLNAEQVAASSKTAQIR